MQAEEARQRRERWQRKGNPPCDHPQLDKEYFLGANSGDYVCIQCGECFSPDELFIDPLTHKRRPKVK